MPIAIDCARDAGPFDHFWCSTGFTPAALLLQPAMRQTIAHLGAIPHSGVRHCRIHYLLDLVTAKNLGTEEPIYDWSRLDAALDVLVDNGLAPFFELMGNVSDFFNDYKDRAQAEAWRRLVADLAHHLIDRYGRDEVVGWYFETWNEPDLPWWRQDLEAFLIYYDACSEGLKQADPDIRFGGPGICETLHPLFTGLLAHCDHGTNHFTGETGVRIDFISAHEKGGKWSNEAVSPDCDRMVARTVRTVEWIRAHCPRLVQVPFFNNECDPLIGWKQFHSWRGWPYYAALVCRIIDLHRREVRERHGIPFGFLSNDNGFLGAWGQRSQLACFGKDQEIAAGRFELVKKPVLNVMTALALLGDRTLAATVDAGAHIGCFATRRGDQIAVLVYHGRDQVWTSGHGTVSLRLTGLPAGPLRLAHYRIDQDHSNPFAVWEAAGYPDFPHKDPAAANYPDTPDVTLFQRLRDAAELELAEDPRDVPVVNGAVALEVDLPLHALCVLVLTPDPGGTPAAPQRVRGEHYTGLTRDEHVMLRWDGDDDRHLRTWEVCYATSADGPFERINTPDLLACGYYHQRSPAPSGGWYRIRAVDLWGRTGPASDAVRL